MGKFESRLDKLLLSRPKMKDYTGMSLVEKDFIDDVVKNYVKKNFVLRVTKIVTNKQLKPKYQDFWMMPWEDLLMIRNAVTANNLFNIFKIVYQIEENDFGNLELLNVFSCYKWIIGQLEIISNAEQEKFKTELTDEQKEAGAEILMEYGYYNSLRSICPDLTKQQEYMKLPYAMIFRELAYINDSQMVTENLHKNASRKNRKNG